jgi:hypothetical protein
MEVMQTIRLTTFITLGLASSAMAAATVPDEYQGVWAAARDCKQSFQVVLSNVVNREVATCRVMQTTTDHPGAQTDSIYLNCEGSRIREIWHSENIDGTDFLVAVQQGAEGGASSIAVYKRCPEIPLSDIPLKDIPGNTVANTASEEKVAPPSHGVQSWKGVSHSRAARVRTKARQ